MECIDRVDAGSNMPARQAFGRGYCTPRKVMRKIVSCLQNYEVKERRKIKTLINNAYSLFNRLSENAKFRKFCIDNKGLMTRKTAKIPILGQPGKI